MEKDIDRISKNNDTDIVIRIDDFGGKRGVTIREFVKGDKYQGFTKAGTRIPADKFHLFKQAINSINEKDLVMEDDIQQQPSSGKKEVKKNPMEKAVDEATEEISKEEVFDEEEDIEDEEI